MLSLVSYAWAGFGAALVPVILISLWAEKRQPAWARSAAGGECRHGAHLEPFAWFEAPGSIPFFLPQVRSISAAFLTIKPDGRVAETFERRRG